MVATVAVLSDIHCVLPVLDAVLAEPDVVAAERIVVTGDHAAGPMPVEVLDRLAGLGDRCLLVRGNADRELVEVARGRESAYDVDNWAGRQLRPDQVELLDGLPHPVRLDVAGFGTVVFCHGSPRDDAEVVLVDTRMSRWAEVLAGLDEADRVVVCGHTHMPFARLVDRRLVVNSGSIGMPNGRAGGSWAPARRAGRAPPHPHRCRRRRRGCGRGVDVPRPAGVGRRVRPLGQQRLRRGRGVRAAGRPSARLTGIADETPQRRRPA